MSTSAPGVSKEAEYFPCGLISRISPFPMATERAPEAGGAAPYPTQPPLPPRRMRSGLTPLEAGERPGGSGGSCCPWSPARPPPCSQPPRQSCRGALRAHSVSPKPTALLSPAPATWPPPVLPTPRLLPSVTPVLSSFFLHVTHRSVPPSSPRAAHRALASQAAASPPELNPASGRGQTDPLVQAGVGPRAQRETLQGRERKEKEVKKNPKITKRER